MRPSAATAFLVFAMLLQPVPSARTETISPSGCRPIEPIIARINASAGGDPVRRVDFTGAEALRLIRAVNAEPPESSLAGTHLVLLERDGYPSLVGLSDDEGCFTGGARLSHEAIDRLFGGQS
jgi:hypothetical protein